MLRDVHGWGLPRTRAALDRLRELALVVEEETYPGRVLPFPMLARGLNRDLIVWLAGATTEAPPPTPFVRRLALLLAHVLADPIQRTQQHLPAVRWLERAAPVFDPIGFSRHFLVSLISWLAGVGALEVDEGGETTHVAPGAADVLHGAPEDLALAYAQLDDLNPAGSLIATLVALDRARQAGDAAPTIDGADEGRKGVVRAPLRARGPVRPRPGRNLRCGVGGPTPAPARARGGDAEGRHGGRAADAGGAARHDVSVHGAADVRGPRGRRRRSRRHGRARPDRRPRVGRPRRAVCADGRVARACGALAGRRRGGDRVARGGGGARPARRRAGDAHGLGAASACDPDVRGNCGRRGNARARGVAAGEPANGARDRAERLPNRGEVDRLVPNGGGGVERADRTDRREGEAIGRGRGWAAGGGAVGEGGSRASRAVGEAGAREAERGGQGDSGARRGGGGPFGIRRTARRRPGADDVR